MILFVVCMVLAVCVLYLASKKTNRKFETMIGHMGRKVSALFLVAAIVLSSVMVSPSTVHAAGWLEYATQTITLGTAVSGSFKNEDYYSSPVGDNNYKYYWHIYKFTMPKKGLLNIYLESLSERYLNYDDYYDGVVVFSASDPDNVVWCSIGGGQNKIRKNYSTSRAMYYGSTEIALEAEDYYFAVRQRHTNDTPYYLTLSYKEPVINVSSIFLSPSSLTMEIGEQKTIIPTVLPNNATDKTVVWKSENPSIATVENGIVKAVSLGNTSISATSTDGEIKAVCPVTVGCNHNYKSSISPAGIGYDGYVSRTCTKCGAETKDRIAAIDSVELSDTLYYYDGEEHKPSVTVLDDNDNALEQGRDYVISYPDSTQDIGTYTVTVNFIGNYEGTKELGFAVSAVSVESISLDMESMTLEIGEQKKLTAAILPDNATDKSILWESSDSSVVTVDDSGMVKAIAVGTAYVIATTADGEKTATCTVDVICDHSYQISLIPATQNSNGLLTEECSKCGDSKRNEIIYAISDISLSSTSCSYNGKTQTPSVTVKDTTGKKLQNNIDYTVSYTGNQKDVGIFT
ncbi:MAG TPA: hypothetical protein DDY31_12395, partial [Lachnospiraceae bacterium]|nr:hypothetical protein [Lachnospiraceae bacterium]